MPVVPVGLTGDGGSVLLLQLQLQLILPNLPYPTLANPTLPYTTLHYPPTTCLLYTSDAADD